MSRMEDHLREALRREEPPEGFAGRVMARIEAARQPERTERREWWWTAFRGPRLRWAAALASLALVAGGIEYRRDQRRIEGEHAKEQVMLALRITGSKLRIAQAKVNRIAYE